MKITLSQEGCARRRERLLKLYAETQLGAVIITDPRDVYYFTGALFPADLPVLYRLDAGGKSLLVAPAEFEVAGVEVVVSYGWNYRGTRDPDPAAAMLASFKKSAGGKRPQRIGVQRTSLLNHIAEELGSPADDTFVPIDVELAAMQRQKDPDEVELIRASIRANFAAYESARAMIAPGVSELEVLSAGREGATCAAGETVFHDGDYQCGAYNGPARDRAIEAGDLYIIDAWTCYRGYWSDMSRTFVVGANPTDIQQALFGHIRYVQREAEKLLRPGVDGTEIYRALDELIREHSLLSDVGLIHHGGHAIGLRIHEMPDINLDRGGYLEPGNVLCIEPGGYFDAARYGVRLENMYLITNSGCENLCPGEIELLRCG